MSNSDSNSNNTKSDTDLISLSSLKLDDNIINKNININSPSNNYSNSPISTNNIHPVLNINSPSINEINEYKHPSSTTNMKSTRRRFLTSRKSLAHSIDFENFNKISPRPNTIDTSNVTSKMNFLNSKSPMPSPQQSPLPAEPINDFFRKSSIKPPTEEEKDASWNRFHSLVNKLTNSSLIKNSVSFDNSPSTFVQKRNSTISLNNALISPNKFLFSPLPSFSEASEVAQLNAYTLGIPENLEEDPIYSFESVINNVYHYSS